MSAKLNHEQIQQRLSDHPAWQQAGDAIQRELVFENFVEAFGFMAKIALHAEKLDHHPDWYNVYNRVKITLNTHDAGGVTDKDFQLATVIDRVAGAGRER